MSIRPHRALGRRALGRRALGCLLGGALVLVAPACNRDKGADDEKDAKDAKDTKDAKDAKASDAGKADAGEEGTLQVDQGDAVLEGPLPPETNAVFFGVEGALYPLACFDKGAKKLLGGDACLKMVPAGTDVRIASKFSSFTKKAGDLTEPQCLAGAGKKVAIAVEGITEGADFVYGTWPLAAIKLVTRADDASTTPAKTQLGDDKKANVTAAVKAAGGNGDPQINQVAELDLDGDGKKELVVAAYIPDPRSDENYTWSGIMVAPGGDLTKLQLVEKNTNGKPDVFEVRGSLDLDGDKQAELWLRRQSQDGSAGDRLYTGPGGKWTGIASWTCGAA
jgi:hypothetical protein